MASWLLGGCGPEVGLVINTLNDMKIERRTLGVPGVNTLSAFPFQFKIHTTLVQNA